MKTSSSVCICTYNGAKYLEREISSIFAQTYPVSEIIVCDDGSTDATLEILQKLQQQAPIPMCIVQNSTRLGHARNFQKAMMMAKGDVVFLADQDDVWHEDKVKTIVQYFACHHRIDLVFSNADFIDADGNRYDSEFSTLFQYNFCKESRRLLRAGLAVELSSYQIFTIGAAMAIRRSFLEQVLPFPDSMLYQCGHDYSLQLAASKNDAIGYIKRPLMSYRLHDGQSSNIMHSIRSISEEMHLSSYSEVWPIPELLPWFQEPEVRPRIEYQTYRNRLIHKVYSPFTIVFRVGTYAHLYGRRFISVMACDARKSLACTLRRLVMAANRRWQA